MNIASTQTCNGCGRDLPANRSFFGNTPSGGFRRKCRQCMAAHTATHNAKHPNQAAGRREKRHAREARAGSKHTPDEVVFLRQRQNDQCAYCLVELNGGGQVDHMTSLAEGGSNAVDNLVLACQQCNLEKHAKSAHEYFWWRDARGLPNYATAYAFKAVYGDD